MQFRSSLLFCAGITIDGAGIDITRGFVSVIPLIIWFAQVTSPKKEYIDRDIFINLYFIHRSGKNWYHRHAPSYHSHEGQTRIFLNCPIFQNSWDKKCIDLLQMRPKLHWCADMHSLRLQVIFSIHNKKAVSSKPSLFCMAPRCCCLISRSGKQCDVENTHMKIYCPSYCIWQHCLEHHLSDCILPQRLWKYIIEIWFKTTTKFVNKL